MVKHMIVWTLKDEYSAEEKVEIKCGIKEGLESLQGKIPGLKEIRVWTEAGELRAEKNGTPLKMVHCGQTRFQGLDTDGSLYTRLEFVIRDGTCIGVRSASRMFARV